LLDILIQEAQEAEQKIAAPRPKSKCVPDSICLGLELVFIRPWHYIDVDDFVLCEFDHDCGITFKGVVSKMETSDSD